MSAPPAVGYQHDAGKLASVVYLAVAVGVVALLGMLPAALEIADHFRFIDDSPGIARWAWLLILLGTIQLAYAVYLVQLPDWSSVWVVALMWLVVATLYAMLLGIVLLSSADNGVLQWLDLDQVTRAKSARWCFMMLSLNSLLTYMAGRTSVRWHRAYRQLTSIAARGAE